MMRMNRTKLYAIGNNFIKKKKGEEEISSEFGIWKEHAHSLEVEKLKCFEL
jgi:hypothetical protein